jgi:putative Mg2+ transporter-C (MgtC) family protein
MQTELFTNLDWSELLRAVVRLLAAIVFGAAIGWERERARRSAGLRTHILVTVGSATFMMLGMEVAERSGSGDPTRIIQGVAMGIGFLGGGAILKLPDEQKVQGLTTAAGIWTTAAMGVAVGAGWLVLAAVLCVLTLLVLAVLRRVEE